MGKFPRDYEKNRAQCVTICVNRMPIKKKVQNLNKTIVVIYSEGMSKSGWKKVL